MKSTFFAISLAALMSNAGSAAAEVFVIASADVQMTAGEVREVFLGDKRSAGTKRLIPVDNRPAQDEFLAKALRMDEGRYRSAWTKKSFREGLFPPVVKSGDLEVIDFVRKTAGTVAYVSTTPSGVKVIGKF